MGWIADLKGYFAKKGEYNRQRYAGRGRHYSTTLSALKEFVDEEDKEIKGYNRLLNSDKITPKQHYNLVKESHRQIKKLTSLEQALAVIILIGAFFISLSREGMLFTGNTIKDESFVATNGLGIGVILLIAALVVLSVKVLLRKHYSL